MGPPMVKPLSEVDRNALGRALALAKERSRGELRRDGETQIERMLKRQLWQEVAQFAVYGCQMKSLGLRPWQFPPAWVSPNDLDPEHADAVALLKRLLDAGLSRWEPDPIGALAKVEPPQAA